MPGPRVYVSRRIPQPALDLLGRECEIEINKTDKTLSKRELMRNLKGCQGLVCLLTDEIDEEVLSLPLVAVANVAVGFNNIDVEAATRNNVLVTNTPEVLTETTADFAWCLMLAAARRLGEGERLVRRGAFHGWGIMMLLGVDVHGKTLGLVGLGRIGQAVARRAKGFNMRLFYSDARRAPETIERELQAEYVPLEKLLKESDFVSLHVPLSQETHHLIGAAELSLMKPTAVLINTSRGPVINEKELVQALKSHHIFAAGLDVYENEPKLATGLKNCGNAVLVPHIASATTETRARMALMAAENMILALKGQRPPNLVNPQAWAARATAKT